MSTVAVIGGGPAGMCAAIYASLNGAEVTIYEKNESLGRKLLLTGNGKCNYSNENISHEFYNFNKGDAADKIIEEFSSEDLEEFFYDMGMLTYNKNGLKYPLSNSASSVLTTLENKIFSLGIDLSTKTEVTNILRNKSGFTVVSDDSSVDYDKVIIATGGKAMPRTGSMGSGYKMARNLGLNVFFTYPGLVPLFTKQTIPNSLSKVRCKASLKGFVNGKEIAFETGELQFTDCGISGIAVFQISRLMTKAIEQKAECQILVNLCPEFDKESLNTFFENVTRANNISFYDLINQSIPKALAEYIFKVSDIDSFAYHKSIFEYSKEDKERVIDNILSLKFDITSHMGYDKAQVTLGGVDMAEFDCNMESIKVPGLFMAGEVVDVDGCCGGYNLHWAFASGRAAGIKAAYNND